ncbi:MAG: arsenite methyltransferase [Ignavibacteriales bacterium]|nr:arsenite methyltransferase [Ignavibacteriales bacterium]
MESAEEIKAVVKEKYGAIAKQSKGQNASSCCGAGGSCSPDVVVFADDYSKLEGYNPDADLGLGCGLPTAIANIKAGDTVVDLGSGAGNDVFVAQKIVGERGRVIGVDMTETMIEKAEANKRKLGITNVEFRYGEIEHLPIEPNTADVVISNCVLNLVPDKSKAFSEIMRVMKPGGHFSISDIVITGQLPEKIQSAAEMYVGCVAGALLKEEYLGAISKTGFKNVQVRKEKNISIPEETLREYLDEKELQLYKQSGAQVLSITVYGEK